jgi:hypothetical protein
MRQLLVSTGAVPVFTAGVLNAGAVEILKKSASGPTPLVAGDIITDSDEIQFVQGTGVKNIFSPWIKANEVIKWRGQSYTAQVPQQTTMTFATAATVAGEMSIKLTSVGQGQEQFKRKNAIVSVTAGQVATGVGGIGQAMLAALVGLPVSSLAITTNYAIPGFPAVAQIDAAWAVITVTGNTFSITANTELGSWSTASEGFGTNGTTLAVAVVTSPTLGSGDAQVLGQYEKSLQGNVGFYNRIVQPNTPDSYIVAATTYDIYTLYIGNPVVGQIKGVDNFRTISIAYAVNGANQAGFEGQINPYLASASGAFAPVNL